MKGLVISVIVGLGLLGGWLLAGPAARTGPPTVTESGATATPSCSGSLEGCQTAPSAVAECTADASAECTKDASERGDAVAESSDESHGDTSATAYTSITVTQTNTAADASCSDSSESCQTTFSAVAESSSTASASCSDENCEATASAVAESTATADASCPDSSEGCEATSRAVAECTTDSIDTSCFDESCEATSSAVAECTTDSIVCEIQKQIGAAGHDLGQIQGKEESFTDKDAGRCNVSVIEAYQTAKASATSRASVVGSGSATSGAGASVSNSITVNQTNAASNITVH